MDHQKLCRNCGSADAADGRLNIVDGTMTPKVKVAVDRRPGKLLANPLNAAIHARVCAGCGLIEFYADDAAKLYEAFLESQQVLSQ